MAVDDRQHALEVILQRLCLVLENVKRCVIVTEDGLLVASYPSDADGKGTGQLIESSELAALSASLAGAGERAMSRLAQGKRSRLVLEGETGTMLCFPVGDVSLAVLVPAAANLAQVLFAAQKAAEEIDLVIARG